ncbi:glycosyltransferase [Marinobacter sp. M3C]|jgi:glycosyltransferase involved in cell wall biosynthesis|uniref:glycosyltransferase n=1 Tax=Marinobacter sp. M3C TaxID=2917715 RepID=UPI00200C87BF|nr:glycosyltransferase [Marinobacter sp. M3C]MCL1479085.1 glycosyltransferase [Marinobacter sp.]UQG61655.1 glycosyltransferase [Marinobacter sp. M3C]
MTQAPQTLLERPLVTFALLAYNQENYIREAVGAALSQDYSPLEIILSDDCSSDATFEIMREMADRYAGLHSIVLNRNVRNLNVGGHINNLNRLAKGELVVAAAGDDISKPDRVSRLVEAWLANGKRSGLLHSARIMITEAGALIGERGHSALEELTSAESAIVNNAHVIGATEAWDRCLFNSYGDFSEGLVHEDLALTFRSLLAGRPVTYIDRPLVLYRYGVGITASYFGPTSRNTSKRMVLLRRLRTDALQRLDDLKVFPNSVVEAAATLALHKYDVAIRFEDGIPGPMELTGMIKRVGFSWVARMFIKYLINIWRDKR